jgi:hypothetical protein
MTRLFLGALVLIVSLSLGYGAHAQMGSVSLVIPDRYGYDGVAS